MYEYKHDTNAIYERFGDRVKFEQRMPDAFAELQGNQFYAINADSLQEVDDIIHFVHERKKEILLCI